MGLVFSPPTWQSTSWEELKRKCLFDGLDLKFWKQPGQEDPQSSFLDEWTGWKTPLHFISYHEHFCILCMSLFLCFKSFPFHVLFKLGSLWSQKLTSSIANRLGDWAGRQLPATFLLDFPSVADAAAELERQHGTVNQQLSALLGRCSFCTRVLPQMNWSVGVRIMMEQMNHEESLLKFSISLKPNHLFK